MALELIRPKPTDVEQKYLIKNVPVYGTLEVSSGSQDQFANISNPRAFDFAKEKGGRLQTIGEALAVRVAFYNDNKKTNEGSDDSEYYQCTSTISLKLKNDGSFKVDAPYVCAFVDLEDNDNSRALVQEQYDARGPLVKPVNDSFICDLIAKARNTGRIAPAQAEGALRISIAKKDGKSAYGQHPNVIAIIGNTKLAELNASYLGELDLEKDYVSPFPGEISWDRPIFEDEVRFKEGRVNDLTTQEIKKLLEGKKDHALVRSVGLGGSDLHIRLLDAGGDGSFSARARVIFHVGEK